MRIDGLSPEVEVRAYWRGCILWACDDYQEKNDCTENRETEVYVDVGEQPALSDHVRLEDLDGTEGRIAGCSAIAFDQTRVLRQG